MSLVDFDCPPAMRGVLQRQDGSLVTQAGRVPLSLSLEDGEYHIAYYIGRAKMPFLQKTFIVAGQNLRVSLRRLPPSYRPQFDVSEASPVIDDEKEAMQRAITQAIELLDHLFHVSEGYSDNPGKVLDERVQVIRRVLRGGLALGEEESDG